MGALDRKGWILFGGTVAMVVIFGASLVIFPQTGVVTYCTAGFETCITNSRSSPWRVLDKPCPAGQSLRFTRPAVFVEVSRCYSLAVQGFSAPLTVRKDTQAMDDEPTTLTFADWVIFEADRIVGMGLRAPQEHRADYMRVQIQVALRRVADHGRAGLSDEDPLLEPWKTST
jgi:hypothetical protein